MKRIVAAGADHMKNTARRQSIHYRQTRYVWAKITGQAQRDKAFTPDTVDAHDIRGEEGGSQDL